MVKNRGITLISLVVTIILLLILAGVTLNLVMGDEGILDKTKKAKEDYTIGSIKEKLELVEGSPYIDKQRQITLDEYFEALDEQKIEPYEVTNKEKMSDEVGIVEVDGKYSFIIRKENDITIEYEGEVGEIDKTEPNIKVILSGENVQTELPIKLEATITNNDEPIDNAKWVLNNESEKIGTDEEKYTGDLKNTSKIDIEINEVKTYYMHVLTKDRFGIKKETIKGPIEINTTCHSHVGSSSKNGGCYTKQNIEYGGNCTEITYTNQRTYNRDVNNCFSYTFICNKCATIFDIYSWTDTDDPNGYFYYESHKNCPKTVKSISYGLTCGKTTETIEKYTISY